MKIPYLWLQDYIDLKDDADALADRLTMTGTAIETVEGSGNEAVLHAEITTNRYDCLSLTGIAKEVSAVYGGEVRLPEVKLPEKKSDAHTFTVEIKDKEACPGYTAVCFEKAVIKEAPAWMTRKLGLMGQPTINNVVDITNYCLFETGQPLHAFDADKLEGGKIIVRRAKKGESIVGINNVKYELDPDMLVIADAKKPVAIAGVMGGKETEITDETENILLESARFDPVLVRSTSRKLKLMTDSSYRFERYVDPNKVLQASERAASLIAELSGAKRSSEWITEGTVFNNDVREVRLSKETLDRVHGEPVAVSEAAQILRSLGLEVKSEDENGCAVIAGSDRIDIDQEADLVEEVTRIRGFEKIPTHIPVTTHVYSGPVEQSDAQYRKILDLKKSLAAQGFWEAVTFSLVSSANLEKIGFPEKSAKIRINNPISAEQEWMRPSHLPGLLDSLSHNLNRQEKNLSFFDLGNRFFEGKEEQVLALIMTGHSFYNWNHKAEASSEYLKGIVENCFRLLAKPVGEWKEAEFDFDADEYTSAISDGRGRKLAQVIKVSSGILSKWKIQQDVFYAEIALDLALELPDRQKKYHEIPKTPAVKRDLAFMLDKKYTVDEVSAVIRKAAGNDLVQLSLFDVYQGKNIPKEKRSLAFNLSYQRQETYTDDEISAFQQKVIAALEKSFQIELRG